MDCLYGFKNWKTNSIRHRGVVRNGLLSEENRYFNFLYFEVSQRFDNLIPEQNPNGYSEKQLKTYRLVNSLYQKGLGYRKISKYLNSINVRTYTGRTWKGSLVYSVMKRFKERQVRIKQKNKKYPMYRSKMIMKFERE